MTEDVELPVKGRPEVSGPAVDRWKANPTASLVDLARSINPRLPADLTGHLVTISFDRGRVAATAIKIDKQ